MKKIISVFSLLLFSMILPAQNSFEISYGTEKDELIMDGMVDLQGNVILVGYREAYEEHEESRMIMKIHPDGSYVVRVFEQLDTIQVFSSVILLENGNYYVTGSFSLTGDQQNRNYLSVTILDTSLNILSEKAFQISNQYTALGINLHTLIDNEGNVVIAAMACRDENGTMFGDFGFFKLTQEGDTLLTRYYHTWYEAEPYALRKMPDSDNLMMISDGLIPFTAGELVFLNKDLNILNYNRLFTMGDGPFYSDVWLNDHEFLMTENNSDHSGASNEYFMAVHRIDTSAQYLNELILNRNDTIEHVSIFKSMAYSNDTTIYISGYQPPSSLWLMLPRKVFLYIIDKDLNLRGHLDLGGDGVYETWGTIATPDDGCLIYGTSYEDITGNMHLDIHIWKVRRDDICLYTSVQMRHGEEPGVYPNPVSDVLNIILDESYTDRTVRFRIYNTMGAKFLDQQLHLDGNQIRTRTGNLPSGVYLYEVIGQDGEKFSGKFMKII